MVSEERLQLGVALCFASRYDVVKLSDLLASFVKLEVVLASFMELLFTVAGSQ